MLKEERQARILEALNEKGRVLAPELVNLLGVSGDTVRRDIGELARGGQATAGARRGLAQVYGGERPARGGCVRLRRGERGRGEGWRPGL